MTFRSITVRRDPACPACGEAAAGGATIRSLDDRASDYDDVSCATPTTSADSINGAAMIREISATELAARMTRGEDVDLVDVREPAEWAIARIEGARLVPLATIGTASHDWDRSREVVLYCKAGVRSMRAAEELVRQGFTNVTSVAGGIVSWTNDVDPSLPRY